ncbi:hypothetical protein ACF0H5_009868 [Mactra antiquata]
MDFKGILTCMCFLLGAVRGRKNVLFFAVDDLRPELTCYEGQDFPSQVHPPIHSPNIDKLAAKSLLLKRAYVQQAVCSPSRTSLLTGRRPDTTHIYDLVHYFRDLGGNFTTIPQYFKENGYISAGMGKIFHPGSASNHDDPISWSIPYYHATEYGWESKKKSWAAIPDDELKDKPLVDYQIAKQALKTLKMFAKGGPHEGTPFFIAVGFHRPHLPFVFPESFLQYYPKNSVKLPPNPYAPSQMPDVAWSSYGELRAYADQNRLNASGGINTTLPDTDILELRRAYYSALSWTDSLVGQVMEELKTYGFENDTIVSFWGDHGWQLGEHGEWCKHTNFELATHAPMMVHIPGMTDNGIVTEQLTEYVDLFPTLVEAAELEPMPLCPENSSEIELCREGTSLIPLIKNPKGLWKDAAFSQYPRTANRTKVMGYTMRTNRYRYTEWVKFSYAPKYKPDWDTVFGVELYDHGSDPEENRNVAYDSTYAALRIDLSVKLHAGWRAAIPPQNEQMKVL